MYHDYRIKIDKKHPLFCYMEDVSKKCNNLYNAALFRQRQVMTAVEKLDEGKSLTENEKEVWDELKKTLPSMPGKFSMPEKGKWALSYNFMDALLKKII